MFRIQSWCHGDPCHNVMATLTSHFHFPSKASKTVSRRWVLYGFLRSFAFTSRGSVSTPTSPPRSVATLPSLSRTLTSHTTTRTRRTLLAPDMTSVLLSHTMVELAVSVLAWCVHVRTPVHTYTYVCSHVHMHFDFVCIFKVWLGAPLTAN